MLSCTVAITCMFQINLALPAIFIPHKCQFRGLNPLCLTFAGFVFLGMSMHG